MKTSIKSIAFIIDGNRRWAKEKKLSSIKGHEKGLDTIIECIGWCNELKFSDATFYAFSSENWKRSKEEVSYLMNLLENFITERLPEVIEQKVRLKFVGKKSLFSKKVQRLIEQAELETRHFKRTAWLCVSYGGRLEVVEAAKILQKSNTKITEKSFEKAMWTGEMPDPQLIIRTGGNHRLSNFLLWKAAYSELYFTKVKWPAFRKKNLLNIIEWYEKNIQVNKGK